MNSGASPNVTANLRLALDKYCSKLKADGSISSCDTPGLVKIYVSVKYQSFKIINKKIVGPDPPLPEYRSWTWWSNNYEEILPYREYPSQVCPEGLFVTDIKWHEDRNTFCDFRILFSGA